jgi:hypothetical protein
MRPHKIEAVAAGALTIAVLAPLIVFGGSRFILLIPAVMAAWLFVFLPFWRRRYRRSAHEAPRWELHPE